MERDAGEPDAVDHVGGALGYRSADGEHDLVVGQMRAHVGTGLLLGSDSRQWMGFGVVRPREASIGATLAATESGGLLGAGGRLRDLALVRGTELRYGALRVRTDRNVSVSVRFDGGRARLVSSPPIAYHTVEGLPVYETGADVTVDLRMSAALSPTGEAVGARLSVPGQRQDGPVPVEVEL